MCVQRKLRKHSHVPRYLKCTYLHKIQCAKDTVTTGKHYPVNVPLRVTLELIFTDLFPSSPSGNSVEYETSRLFGDVTVCLEQSTKTVSHLSFLSPNHNFIFTVKTFVIYQTFCSTN